MSQKSKSQSNVPETKGKVAGFHPELTAARYIPPFSIGPLLTGIFNRLPVKQSTPPEDLLVEDVKVPGPPGAPPVLMRLYRPRAARTPMPALLWLHGGGMVLGNHLMDEASSIAIARTLGITVASVEYRLAPQHPAPAAVEDAYAALTWLFDHSAERSIDKERIAIGGGSAGGGIAAGLALLAHDRAEITPAFQLLIYPMLDDRTVLRTDIDTRGHRLWTASSNRWGWGAYLGRPPGGSDVSPYAAPARRADLSGLPPAWIGIGTLDLFYDENISYAKRLEEGGVPCELYVVPGAFHGFNGAFPKKNVSKDFWRAQVSALHRALQLPPDPNTDMKENDDPQERWAPSAG